MALGNCSAMHQKLGSLLPCSLDGACLTASITCQTELAVLNRFFPLLYCALQEAEVNYDSIPGGATLAPCLAHAQSQSFAQGVVILTLQS
eukprot:1140791-Pelagomonas_calceolata.AAC.1